MGRIHTLEGVNRRTLSALVGGCVCTDHTDLHRYRVEHFAYAIHPLLIRLPANMAHQTRPANH